LGQIQRRGEEVGGGGSSFVAVQARNDKRAVSLSVTNSRQTLSVSHRCRAAQGRVPPLAGRGL